MKLRILFCRLAIVALAFACATASAREKTSVVPKWGRFEQAFASSERYASPIEEVDLRVTFVSPSGRMKTVYGFWDGRRTWRARFSPDEIGTWNYTTKCSNAADAGLHQRSGKFICTAATKGNHFKERGPVQVARSGHFLAHQDGTPFFWLGLPEKDFLIEQRPGAGTLPLNALAQYSYTGIQADVPELNPARIDPAMFRPWDAAIGAANQANLAIGAVLKSSADVKLARYALARWDSYGVIWIVEGDESAEALRRFGRAVFGGISHSPVAILQRGETWVADELSGEEWLSICGFDVNDDVSGLKFIVQGPPSTAWTKTPPRAMMNLGGSASRQGAFLSLLSAPPSGITTLAPAAIAEVFGSIAFWRLRPAPELLALQPGETDPNAHVASSKTARGDLALLYVPEAVKKISLRIDQMPPRATTTWFNARTGKPAQVIAILTDKTIDFASPGEGDWLLLLQSRPE